MVLKSRADGAGVAIFAQDEAFLLNELLKHQVLLQDHTLYRAVVLRADGASFRSEATDLMLFKLKKAGRLLQWAVPSGFF